MIRIYVIIVLGWCLSSCGQITNRFDVLSKSDIKHEKCYTRYDFIPEEIYTIRLKQKIENKYKGVDNDDYRYSDTPFPIFHNVDTIVDKSHIVEENYFVLLGSSEENESGVLLSMSTYYIKNRSLQAACFDNESYISTYPIQMVEFGTWSRDTKGLVDLTIKRKKECLHFAGILEKGKLIITEADHPKQNPSALYGQNQPMVKVKDILLVKDGLTYLNMVNREWIYPNWDELSGETANGTILKDMLESLKGTQKFDKVWINEKGGKGSQFIMVESQYDMAIRYNKKIK